MMLFSLSLFFFPLSFLPSFLPLHGPGVAFSSQEASPKVERWGCHTRAPGIGMERGAKKSQSLAIASNNQHSS